MEIILTYRLEMMVGSLKLIHYFLLYYSDMIIDQEEKSALADKDYLEGIEFNTKLPAHTSRWK